MVTWVDQVQAYSSIASIIIGLISVIFVIASLRQASTALKAQNRSTDVSSVITLFERLDAHWCRFKEAREESKRDFEFGQLIGYYELSCRLFRDRVFQTNAALTLYEHLHDVLNAMLAHPDFKQRFEAVRSQPDNYENIIWLCEQPRRLTAFPHRYERVSAVAT
ncbi:hypothetical protein MZO42_16490 [Sphingomonas psychrotolerans]|uniref:DUF4760 domain-containing protein n=1 Tax=Sphingomonas psychrotolerans TaxID=1327635 RepID=A0ABU3N7Q0_9SPHN|nr:hypothetical protein [Sphingomonas psychrotolerans]MDT8760301.1 hypothetical protein [Sphingomonas psychrotolerans]